MLKNKDTAKADEAQKQEETTQEDASEKTFTQEDVDKIVGERLYREREKYEGFDEYKEKSSKYDDLLSEYKELQSKKSKIEDELADLKAKNELKEIKQKVAEEYNVPIKALKGNTEDELKEHAEILQELAKIPSAPVVSGDGITKIDGNLGEESAFIKKLFKGE